MRIRTISEGWDKIEIKRLKNLYTDNTTNFKWIFELLGWEKK